MKLKKKKKFKKAKHSHLQGTAEAPGKARHAPPLVVKAESAAVHPLLPGQGLPAHAWRARFCTPSPAPH